MPREMAQLNAWPTGITRAIGERGARTRSSAAQVQGHALDWLARPMFAGRVGQIGTRPGRDQADIHARVSFSEERRQVTRRRYRIGDVARLIGTERAILLEHDCVPTPVNHRALVLQMPFERLARRS